MPMQLQSFDARQKKWTSRPLAEMTQWAGDLAARGDNIDKIRHRSNARRSNRKIISRPDCRPESKTVFHRDETEASAPPRDAGRDVRLQVRPALTNNTKSRVSRDEEMDSDDLTYPIN